MLQTAPATQVRSWESGAAPIRNKLPTSITAARATKQSSSKPRPWHQQSRNTPPAEVIRSSWLKVVPASDSWRFCLAREWKSAMALSSPHVSSTKSTSLELKPLPTMSLRKQVRPLTHVRSWEKERLQSQWLHPHLPWSFLAQSRETGQSTSTTYTSPPVSGRGKLTNLVDGDLPGSSKPPRREYIAKQSLKHLHRSPRTKYWSKLDKWLPNRPLISQVIPDTHVFAWLRGEIPTRVKDPTSTVNSCAFEHPVEVSPEHQQSL